MMKGSKQDTLTADEVLRHLLALMPGYLYWKDSEGVYQGCNDSHAQRLGLKSGREAQGKRDADLLGKDANASFSSYDDLVMLQGRTRVIEEQFTLRDQPLILLSLKAPMLGKKRQILGLLNISIDISRQRRMEEKVSLLKKTLHETGLNQSSPGKRLLIVDKDCLASRALQSFFEQAGCQVGFASDADYALTKAFKEDYHLIFMDLRLENSQGVNVAQTIRNQSGRNQTTPHYCL